jgi:hypothetical protein
MVFAFSLPNLFLFINLILFILLAVKTKQKTHKIITVYLLVIVGVQFYSAWVAFNGNYNLHISHYYFVFQLLLLGYFYHTISVNNLQRKIIKYSILVCLLILGIQYANTSQNRAVNDPMTDPMHSVTTDRLQETQTSKDHLDDNATINRRNENTETVERMDRRDDIHNTTQDNKVQATAAANTRRTLYSHLSMSQDQIKQMESFQRDYNNQMSENTLSESQMDTEMRMDKNLKEILSEDQYRKYEAWKRENPNTRF